MKYLLTLLLIATTAVQAKDLLVKLPASNMVEYLYYCEYPLVGQTCAYLKPNGQVIRPRTDVGWDLPDEEMLRYTHRKHIAAGRDYRMSGEIADRLNEYYWAIRMIAARNDASPDIATLRFSQRLEGLDASFSEFLGTLDFNSQALAKDRLQNLYDRAVKATALAIWLEHKFGLPID